MKLLNSVNKNVTMVYKIPKYEKKNAKKMTYFSSFVCYLCFRGVLGPFQTDPTSSFLTVIFISYITL